MKYTFVFKNDTQYIVIAKNLKRARLLLMKIYGPHVFLMLKKLVILDNRR